MEKLTDKQKRSIPKILASNTHKEAAKKIGISQKQLCHWLQDKTFKQELESYRDLLIAEAVNQIAKNISKAVETLIALLDSEAENTRRMAAKDILEYYFKFRDFADFQQRLEAVEEILKKNT